MNLLETAAFYSNLFVDGVDQCLYVWRNEFHVPPPQNEYPSTRQGDHAWRTTVGVWVFSMYIYLGLKDVYFRKYLFIESRINFSSICADKYSLSGLLI